MIDNNRSYKQVVKATSLFGGVNFIKIVLSVVRSKAIALLIGPEGMGIASLFMTTLNLMNGVTNLGLDKSAVKDISFEKEKNKDEAVKKTMAVLSRLVWITGITGTLLIMVLSPVLSKVAFGDNQYTLSFIWIAVSLLFIQLTHGRLAILQGLRKLKTLAKANIWGNALALICTLPIYYFFRIDGIVPAIIISSITAFVVTQYYTWKSNIVVESIETSVVFSEGKSMIRLGVMLSISSLMSLIAAYILQAYISAQGGLDEVGFYNAGFVILNTYVGLIFSAMAADYFPRLSGIADDLAKVRKTVFEQAHVAILLISPVIIFFIAFAPQLIRLLFSSEFSPVIVFVTWGILGMFFKAVSFSVGYIIIAKGDSKLFIKTAVIFNVLLLLLNVMGYTYYGLLGLGISFLVYYVIHFLAIQIITYYRYQFFFKREFYYVFSLSLFLCLAAFGATFIDGVVFKYGILVVLILVSGVYSFFQLNKRLDIVATIKAYLNRS